MSDFDLSNSLFGRRQLLTIAEVITSGNIVEVLNSVLLTHAENAREIRFLQRYRRGDQPILRRKKKIRPEICNRVVKNRANEIVNFKTGYLLGDPIQYVTNEVDSRTAEELKILNKGMYTSKKANLDKKLASHMYEVGVGYRLIVANKKYNPSIRDSSPFIIDVLDPATAGVVYTTATGSAPVLCFVDKIFKENDTEKHKYCCYTTTEYFEIVEDKIILQTPHTYGELPIIEYLPNEIRMGAFEHVISILNAINTVTSNRVDGVEQFVQHLMKLVNVDMEAQDINMLHEYGAIKIKRDNTAGGIVQDIEIMTNELNQSQIQTLVDSLDMDVLILCSMPNRNGGSSTSDTGSAVIMRDGWSDAEASAKDVESSFKASEIDFLKVALKIASDLKYCNLEVSDIDTKFTRRNYENSSQKATVLTTMLSNPKIHPKLAFQYCGMFTDPELAFKESKEYMDSIDNEPIIEEEVTDEDS